MLIQWMNELVSWWAALPRDMAFFFSLPFLVAAAGLIAHSISLSKSEDNRKD